MVVVSNMVVCLLFFSEELCFASASCVFILSLGGLGLVNACPISGVNWKHGFSFKKQV